jgi:hypothetical protein
MTAVANQLSAIPLQVNKAAIPFEMKLEMLK